jgi:hypothetical protein
MAGLSRPSTISGANVDARHKAGHDGLGQCVGRTSEAHPPIDAIGCAIRFAIAPYELRGFDWHRLVIPGCGRRRSRLTQARNPEMFITSRDSGFTRS